MKINKEFLLSREYQEIANDQYGEVTYTLTSGKNGSRNLSVRYSSPSDSCNGFDVYFNWQRIPFCQTQEDLIVLERICLGEK